MRADGGEAEGAGREKQVEAEASTG